MTDFCCFLKKLKFENTFWQNLKRKNMGYVNFLNEKVRGIYDIQNHVRERHI